MSLIKRKEARGCVKYTEIVLFLIAAEEIVNAWIKLARVALGWFVQAGHWAPIPSLYSKHSGGRDVIWRQWPPAMTSWFPFPVVPGSFLCRVCVPPCSGVGLMPIMMLWIRTHCIRVDEKLYLFHRRRDTHVDSPARWVTHSPGETHTHIHSHIKRRGGVPVYTAKQQLLKEVSALPHASSK